MVVDVDRFKLINDEFGHTIGDQMLQELARGMQEAVRPEDSVARFGGDEFVVLLESPPNLSDVEAIAERIVLRAREPVETGSRQLVCTVSVGVATTADGRRSVAELLQQADAALYRAKRLGRNQIVVAAATTARVAVVNHFEGFTEDGVDDP